MMNPFYFFDGTFMLTYERLFPTGSLRITPSITLQNVNNGNFDQREGWGLDFGYKFFLSPPKRVNLYMGPYALYRKLSVGGNHYIDDNGYAGYRYRTDVYDILGLGVDAGIKFIIGGRIVIDLSLGGGVRYPYLNGKTFNSTANDIFDVDYKGVVPRGNFSIGIAF